MVDRTKAITIRMAPEEVEMLREVAERMGLSQSDVVRQFIRRAHEENSRGQPKKRKK